MKSRSADIQKLCVCRYMARHITQRRSTITDRERIRLPGDDKVDGGAVGVAVDEVLPRQEALGAHQLGET